MEFFFITLCLFVLSGIGLVFYPPLHETENDLLRRTMLITALPAYALTLLVVWGVCAVIDTLFGTPKNGTASEDLYDELTELPENVVKAWRGEHIDGALDD